MNTIPENEVTQQDLFLWYEMQEQLKKLKAAEMLLRQKIYKGKFPSAYAGEKGTEGTNSLDLGDGYVLKAKRTIDRKVDPGSLVAIRSKFEELNIVEGALFKYTPELILKTYRGLTEQQMHLIDQALIIKDGSPSLEIVLPAKNRPQAG